MTEQKDNISPQVPAIIQKTVSDFSQKLREAVVYVDGDSYPVFTGAALNSVSPEGHTLEVTALVRAERCGIRNKNPSTILRVSRVRSSLSREVRRAFESVMQRSDLQQLGIKYVDISVERPAGRDGKTPRYPGAMINLNSRWEI